ncbi:GIY-YIG nuclease family protein [Candidatus Uhrbacteria bacterium]|nr:GIY-YIG nuclease family protein [Candidatus Uhrbacteria bacterium]
MIKSKAEHFMYVGCTNNLKRRFDEHNAGIQHII